MNTVDIHHELIMKCKVQDPTAQFQIYNLYHKAMYNTALRIVNDRDDAQDAIQEAFINAFKYIKRYRGEATFGAWLKRIVINKSLSVLNKRQKDAMLISDIADEETVAQTVNEDPESVYTVDQIKKTMAMLPAGFRSVLSLYLFEGFDHKEISQILNITESTSKTQYKRAKDKLRALLIKEVQYG